MVTICMHKTNRIYWFLMETLLIQTSCDLIRWEWHNKRDVNEIFLTNLNALNFHSRLFPTPANPSDIPGASLGILILPVFGYARESITTSVFKGRIDFFLSRMSILLQKIIMIHWLTLEILLIKESCNLIGWEQFKFLL